MGHEPIQTGPLSVSSASIYPTDTSFVVNGVTYGTVLSVGNEASAKPSIYTLSQNFPNPFNPATTIRYSIAAPQVVTLTVYDLLGRVVETFADGKKIPGTYTVVWNASCRSSGVYFIRLIAGKFIDTRKMLLLK